MDRWAGQEHPIGGKDRVRTVHSTEEEEAVVDRGGYGGYRIRGRGEEEDKKKRDRGGKDRRYTKYGTIRYGTVRNSPVISWPVGSSPWFYQSNWGPFANDGSTRLSTCFNGLSPSNMVSFRHIQSKGSHGATSTRYVLLPPNQTTSHSRGISRRASLRGVGETSHDPQEE
jgi:hypothetical protein